jgi:membrane protease YdiL (CAAX protease family)
MNDTKDIAIRVIGAVVLGIIVLITSSIFAIIVYEIFLESTDSMFGIGFLTHSGMLGLSLIIMYFLTKGNLSEYRFKKPTHLHLGRIILISFCLGIVVAFARTLISAEGFGTLEDYISIELILEVWLYASIAEEIFTRGLIQGYLNPYTGSGIRISSGFISIPVLVGALFFGFMHLATLTLGFDFLTVIATVLSAIFVGILAGYYCEKTGSLIPPILIHMLFNITGSLVGVLFVLL